MVGEYLSVVGMGVGINVGVSISVTGVIIGGIVCATPWDYNLSIIAPSIRPDPASPP